MQVEEIFTFLHGVGDDNEWQEILSLMRQAYAQNLSVQDFAAKIGLSKGVTGYVYHTVPVAIYGWMRHYGDFEKTLIEVLNCGGDTDTVGAIAGALAGVTVGENEIPKDWVKEIIDFPVSKSLLRKLGHQIAIQKQGAKKIPKEVLFWISLLPRNLLFLLVIFIHAFRRFLPPY